ncbi:helix-turn-helix domain-containing protein [Leifsonia sp. McL0607]|uniref:helix-turn-helix domain-containing protein n=1 Tax=Leifsonia sp. McL0607 TaxID=3415672 RepID=UPI003CEA26EE
MLRSHESNDYDQFRRRIGAYSMPYIGRSKSSRTFSLSFGARRFGDIAVSHVSGSDHTIEQTSSPGEAGLDDYRWILIPLDGENHLVQDDRSATIRAGDLALYTASRPFSVDFSGESFLFRVPKQQLHLPDRTIDDFVGVRLDRERPLVGIVNPIARQLGQTLLDIDASVGRHLLNGAVETIVAVMMETGRPAANSTREQQVYRVLDYIDENLSRSGLTVAEIARANFMSARKLHALFELHGTTVAEWVRSRRLENTRRELADSANSHLRVSEIAARWGFKDPAHFSRLFTDRYGSSPRALRSTALGTRAFSPDSHELAMR